MNSYLLAHLPMQLTYRYLPNEGPDSEGGATLDAIHKLNPRTALNMLKNLEKLRRGGIEFVFYWNPYIEKGAGQGQGITRYYLFISRYS